MSKSMSNNWSTVWQFPLLNTHKHTLSKLVQTCIVRSNIDIMKVCIFWWERTKTTNTCKHAIGCDISGKTEEEKWYFFRFKMSNLHFLWFSPFRGFRGVPKCESKKIISFDFPSFPLMMHSNPHTYTHPTVLQNQWHLFPNFVDKKAFEFCSLYIWFFFST